LSNIDNLFKQNQKWAASILEEDPEFFTKLSKQQAPEYLWIGCSDSRVPANQIVNLPPGEVFVHRNIANVVVHTDLNCLSVIQYAIEVLRIKHIVVCGHYGCGGVEAALKSDDLGLIDNWLKHIEDVSRFHQAELEQLSGKNKINRLCELNVIEQVKNVCKTSIVKKAWSENQELFVHGWIYDISNGILKDLDTNICSEDELISS